MHQKIHCFWINAIVSILYSPCMRLHNPALWIGRDVCFVAFSSVQHYFSTGSSEYERSGSTLFSAQRISYQIVSYLQTSKIHRQRST